MSHGRGTRRTGAILVCLGLLALTPGCRRSPFQRLVSPGEADPASSAAPAPSFDSPMGAGIVSPPSPSPVPVAESAVVSIAPAPVATPLLDAALKRAEAEEKIQRDLLSAHESSPPVSPSTRPVMISMTNAPAKPIKQIAPPAPSVSAVPADPKPPQALAASRQGGKGDLVGPPEPPALLPAPEPVIAASTDAVKPKLAALVDKGQSTGLHSVVLALEDHPPLVITDLRLCRKVVGFGSFESVEPRGIKPGQPVIVYCELAGLRYQSKEQGFLSRLSSRVELTTSPGGVKAWEQSLGEAEDHCRSRRRDIFVNHRITLPEGLSPGDYRLRLTLTDLVAGRTTSSEMPLTVVR